MGIFAGIALLMIFVFSSVSILLAWTSKVEDEWDTEDNKNWDWHR